MKKLLLGICLFLGFVFIGCVSNSMAHVFDPRIPEDQMSFLWVPNYVRVEQFDDKTVEWMAPLLSLTPVKVGVPSGEHTLMIDTFIVEPNTAEIPDIKDKSFTNRFETGKGYQLTSRNGDIVLIDLE